MEKQIRTKIWKSHGVTKVIRKSLNHRSLIVVTLILLMFLSTFSVLTRNANAIVAVPYDNIGTNWNRNPNLILNDGAWDSRVWQWGVSTLEPYGGDANNYVKWNGDGKVDSQAQDWTGGPFIASNFDQGYEKYENEIPNLNAWGNWNDRASSLKIAGSITLFDGLAYTGASQIFTANTPDLAAYNWNSKAASLKLALGSQVTLYSNPGYSGDNITFIAPSYQPPALKIADTNSITVEGVVSNWYTDTWTSPGWTGVKFDIFAVEDLHGNTGKTLMLEMYILRDGANLAWSTYNLLQGCSGNDREGFRGPPYQSSYNYLVAVDAFPGIANMTTYPGNVAKWTIDVKALIQRASDHNWGVSPSYFHVDFSQLSIAKICFTVESANLGLSARVGASLNRLRLAYTDNSTIYSENAYDKPQSGTSFSRVSDPSSLSGIVLEAAASSPNMGMLFGPYITTGSDGSSLGGKYLSANFKLKVSSNVINNYVGYIDVRYNQGTILKSSQIKASDFAGADTWQDFEVSFVVPTSMSYGLEFRVANSNNGITDLFIDRILITPVHAAVSELKAYALQTDASQAYFVYGDPHRMTDAMSTYDVAAGGIVYGMCTNTQIQSFDTNPQVVSQSIANKGRLLIGQKTALMFGGPNPNLVVRYLEQQKLTPLYFQAITDSAGNHLKFVETATGAAKVDALISSYDSEHENYFIVESLIDTYYNHVFISYGFDWKGTWAAGLYLKTLTSTIQSYTNAYYVFHWVDTNGNGIPEPGEITQVATG